MLFKKKKDKESRKRKKKKKLDNLRRKWHPRLQLKKPERRLKRKN